jgi:hypothetical protein
LSIAIKYYAKSKYIRLWFNLNFNFNWFGCAVFFDTKITNGTVDNKFKKNCPQFLKLPDARMFFELYSTQCPDNLRTLEPQYTQHNLKRNLEFLPIQKMETLNWVLKFTTECTENSMRIIFEHS